MISKLLLDRQPINLIRQESAATSIYLDILQKSIYGFDTDIEGSPQSNGFHDADTISDNGLSISENSKAEINFVKIVEERMVAFFEQALKEASDIHSGAGHAANMDIHRVLELRAPLIVKVENIYFILLY